jgi:preprotein translocase subunit SecG
MFIAAVVVIAITCILLILVVLVQNSKGGGLAAGIGGGLSANIVGVKRTNDLLENITWGLAIFLLISCLGTNLLIDRDGEDDTVEVNSVNVERAQESGFVPQQKAAPAPQSEATEEEQ